MKEHWCLPQPRTETEKARFVCAMEDILDLYEQPDDPKSPRVCFDECPFQFVADVVAPLAAQPGRPTREDYEYERRGVCNLFVLSDPFRGGCRVEATAQRTKQDFARCMKRLVDEGYPHAERIRVVLDNLNTHTEAALYEAFPPEEACRILRRLEFHHTPKHASWLNMAEIEISVLSRQCLHRRIPDMETLQRELDAWQAQRNRDGVVVNWRFATPDARYKLKRLYPELPQSSH